jgi:PAS domain S-box-containing protein
MNLREKMLLIITGFVISAILIIMIISFTLFLDNYRKIETEYVTDFTEVVTKNTYEEVSRLDSYIMDWGPWDDTYAFAGGEYDTYPDNNLVPESFINQKFNFIIIVNPEGDIIYGRGFDLETDSFTSVRPDVLDELKNPESRFRVLEASDSNAGFLNLPGGMVLAASYPVLKSDYTGPPRGTIIMGKYMDQAAINGLSLVSLPTISITELGQTGLEGPGPVLQGSGEPIVKVIPINENQIEGRQIYTNDYGRDTQLFTISMTRDIYKQGKMNILSFILIFLFISLLEGLMIIWLIDHQILIRLTAINEEINEITDKKNGMIRINYRGNDEISRLTATMNRLLDQIDEDQLKLQGSEKRFREFAENFPESLLELDLEGIPTFVNHAAYDKFGYCPGELEKNVPAANLLAPEERPRAQEDFYRVLQGENLTGAEYTGLKKDGSRFPLILYSAPIIRGEKPQGLRIFAGDISERKRMENALLEMNKKINLLNSITRHDVSNQLQILFAFMELVDETVVDPSIQEYINHQKRAAETIQRQIAFTKEYQEIGVQAPQWQNLEQVVLRATKGIDLSAISVTVDLPGIEIYADTLMERVFFNLIDNARKYGGKISWIRISCKEIPEGYVVFCEDDGDGIPSERKEGIFTRKYFTNTGFGLFLSREILAITGITIQETGEPGKGAKFEMIVPKGVWRIKRDGA